MRAILLLTFLANVELKGHTEKRQLDYLSMDTETTQPPIARDRDYVQIICNDGKMFVQVTLAKVFSGLFYVEGSFSREPSPCSLGSVYGKQFSMVIPLNGCSTIRDGNKYSTILVLQQDNYIQTADDMFFNLICYWQPSPNITTTMDFINTKKRSIGSRRHPFWERRGEKGGVHRKLQR